jgi:Cu/Ag efflux protein CusF
MSMKVVSPLVLAAVTAMASSALAASMTKTGDIRSTDAAKHELTLSSGETFTVDSHVKLGSFKTGDKVAVTYDTKDGKKLASKVKQAK